MPQCDAAFDAATLKSEKPMSVMVGTMTMGVIHLSRTPTTPVMEERGRGGGGGGGRGERGGKRKEERERRKGKKGE